VKARLTQLLTDVHHHNSSTPPKWLISFDGLPIKDEEVYEAAFAIPDDGNSDYESDHDFIGGNLALYVSDNEGDHRRHSRIRQHHPHSRHYDNNNNPRQQQQSDGNSTSDRDDSIPTNIKPQRTTLAREARSKRRQSKIKELASNDQNQHKRFRRLAPPPPNFHVPTNRLHYSSHQHKGKRGGNHHYHQGDDDEEEVVQLKLLTGTLLIYKGLHRRAEFIRKV